MFSQQAFTLLSFVILNRRLADACADESYHCPVSPANRKMT